jgi:hypothetical protein
MVDVEVIHMGAPFHELNLAEVVKIGNLAQQHFRFISGDKILHLGDPDEDGRYGVSQLIDLLEARKKGNAARIFVGVIDSPLQDELFSAVDSTNSHIIVSIDDIAGILSTSNKACVDYVLFEIAAQLLTIEYRRSIGKCAPPEECHDPWHKETRSCVFDYCDYRPQTWKKLISLHLCDECRMLLSSPDIQTVMTACLDLVKKAVRTRISTVLHATASDRFMQIVFGGSAISLFAIALNQWGFTIWQIIAIYVLTLITIVVVRYLRMRRS